MKNCHFAILSHSDKHTRHLFREMVQGEDEMIDQFAVQLRHKAQQCDYGDQMEAQIRDQIILKCCSNE